MPKLLVPITGLYFYLKGKIRIVLISFFVNLTQSKSYLGRTSMRKCLHHNGLKEVCGTFSWLTVGGPVGDATPGQMGLACVRNQAEQESKEHSSKGSCCSSASQFPTLALLSGCWLLNDGQQSLSAGMKPSLYLQSGWSVFYHSNRKVN